MINRRTRPLITILIVVCFSILAIARQQNSQPPPTAPARPPDTAGARPPLAAEFKAPDTIDFRSANITSEGVRLHAELFSLKALAGKRLPTIIMAHGWGGTAANFRSDAIDFAGAGYLVITFDYRGWGESDSRLILTGPSPIKPISGQNQKFIAEVTEIREVVDPLEQTTDWFNVIAWAVGEPMVDKDRIGLRGSSYSGGHVFYVAARDPRIKAVVSQVGSFDSRLPLSAPGTLTMINTQTTKRARGEQGYPPPGARVIGNLLGAPIFDKLLQYAPVDDAPKVKDCAVLFIVAEKEELFNNKDHAKLAYDRMAGTKKKYVSIPNITHYDIYRTARAEAIKLGIDWFDEYLKK